MKGYVTKCMLFLVCLFFLTMNALAANPSSLADGAQLLKGSERIAVLNEIGSVEKKYGVRLAVVTVASTKQVKIGDYVVFPSKADRKINIGVVESDFIYNPEAAPYVQQRKVKWLKHLPRTAFSQGALYEVGSALSFFLLKNYADEYMQTLDKGFKPSLALAEPDETVATTAEDIVEATRDFVLKELSKQLKGYALEEFVAELLRAMGYRCTVSPQGGDSGIDITAYKDELPPRILVQVKSQDSDIKESTIQSLKGAMREGDYGLFVTLSNYTKNAAKYLESTPIIRGINGTELVDLILKYYGQLSEKYRRMIPLRMVYIPVPEEKL